MKMKCQSQSSRTSVLCAQWKLVERVRGERSREMRSILHPGEMPDVSPVCLLESISMTWKYLL